MLLSSLLLPSRMMRTVRARTASPRMARIQPLSPPTARTRMVSPPMVRVPTARRVRTSSVRDSSAQQPSQYGQGYPSRASRVSLITTSTSRTPTSSPARISTTMASRVITLPGLEEDPGVGYHLDDSRYCWYSDRFLRHRSAPGHCCRCSGYHFAEAD